MGYEVTQRRSGKTEKSQRQSERDTRFTWIILLQVVQTALLVLILINTTEWNPFSRLSLVSKPDSEIVEDYTIPESVIIEEPEEIITPAEIPNPIKVEVLNGCGVAGIASRTADFLRKKGFDVRDFKNAERSNYTHTVIYVRGSALAPGEDLAKNIALPLEMVKLKPDPDLVDIDVTLIIGRDHRQYILPR